MAQHKEHRGFFYFHTLKEIWKIYPYDKSAQIKAALRGGFRDSTSKLSDRKCFGYDRAQDGSLKINLEEAKTIQWIFESYLSGNSLGEIAGGLESGMPSPTGKLKWDCEANLEDPLKREIRWKSVASKDCIILRLSSEKR